MVTSCIKLTHIRMYVHTPRSVRNLSFKFTSYLLQPDVRLTCLNAIRLSFLSSSHVEEVSSFHSLLFSLSASQNIPASIHSELCATQRRIYYIP